MKRYLERQRDIAQARAMPSDEFPTAAERARDVAESRDTLRDIRALAKLGYDATSLFYEHCEFCGERIYRVAIPVRVDEEVYRNCTFLHTDGTYECSDGSGHKFQTPEDKRKSDEAFAAVIHAARKHAHDYAAKRRPVGGFTCKACGGQMLKPADSSIAPTPWECRCELCGWHPDPPQMVA